MQHGGPQVPTLRVFLKEQSAGWEYMASKRQFFCLESSLWNHEFDQFLGCIVQTSPQDVQGRIPSRQRLHQASWSASCERIFRTTHHNSWMFCFVKFRNRRIYNPQNANVPHEAPQSADFCCPNCRAPKDSLAARDSFPGLRFLGVQREHQYQDASACSARAPEHRPGDLWAAITC